MKCVPAKQGFAGKAHDNVFFGDIVATSSPLDTKCVSSAGVRPLTSADGGREDKVIIQRTPRAKARGVCTRAKPVMASRSEGS